MILAYSTAEPQDEGAESETEHESTVSDSSEETITQSSYNEKVIAEKRNEVEQLNKDITETEESLSNLEEVAKSNKTLPEDQKYEDENLEQYKDDYPDYFNKGEEHSVEKSLELIKNEKLNEIKEKEEQVKVIQEQINKQDTSTESSNNDEEDFFFDFM